MDYSRRPPLSFARIPGAPAPGSVLFALEELADNDCRVLEYRDGDKIFELFVHRMGDSVVSYRNRCPHAGTPLDWVPGQFLDATGSEFQCATHGARFRKTDGFCTHGPCAGAFLQSVQVRVENGMVLAD